MVDEFGIKVVSGRFTVVEDNVEVDEEEVTVVAVVDDGAVVDEVTVVGDDVEAGAELVELVVAVVADTVVVAVLGSITVCTMHSHNTAVQIYCRFPCL